METTTPWAIPAHGKRSSLATVTRSWSPPDNGRPSRRNVAPWMKLCVEPVSSRVSKRSPLMVTYITILISVCKPATACRETTNALADASRRAPMSSSVAPWCGGVSSSSV
jgi:hypothetical protein